MLKRAVILLSFLMYSLTLVHSIVPHHHHKKPTSEHHHYHHHDAKDHHHDNEDHEEKSLSHAFADAIHFPGFEVAIHAKHSATIAKVSPGGDLFIQIFTSFVLPQLKPPDLNVDRRQAHYSSAHQALSLLRAPPVA